MYLNGPEVCKVETPQMCIPTLKTDALFCKLHLLSIPGINPLVLSQGTLSSSESFEGISASLGETWQMLLLYISFTR